MKVARQSGPKSENDISTVELQSLAPCSRKYKENSVPMGRKEGRGIGVGIILLSDLHSWAGPFPTLFFSREIPR